MTAELLKTARRITGAARHRPSQADLRRAISTSYYALFDALARRWADEIVGSSATRRVTPEWLRVYRALNHGRSESALDEIDPGRKRRSATPQSSGLDTNLKLFCDVLEKQRQYRIRADYDPRPLRLRRQEIVELIDEAQTALDGLDAASSEQRRALAYACIVPVRRI